MGIFTYKPDIEHKTVLDNGIKFLYRNLLQQTVYLVIKGKSGNYYHCEFKSDLLVVKGNNAETILRRAITIARNGSHCKQFTPEGYLPGIFKSCGEFGAVVFIRLNDSMTVVTSTKDFNDKSVGTIADIFDRLKKGTEFELVSELRIAANICKRLSNVDKLKSLAVICYKIRAEIEANCRSLRDASSFILEVSTIMDSNTRRLEEISKFCAELHIQMFLAERPPTVSGIRNLSKEKIFKNVNHDGEFEDGTDLLNQLIHSDPSAFTPSFNAYRLQLGVALSNEIQYWTRVKRASEETGKLIIGLRAHIEWLNEIEKDYFKVCRDQHEFVDEERRLRVTKRTREDNEPDVVAKVIKLGL